MTDIEKRALALLNEVERSSWEYYEIERIPNFSALCRAIEQHEAFRHEVSDAVEEVRDTTTWDVHPKLWRFIIPKPVDPLVEALREAGEQTGGQVSNERLAHDLRAAMKARGYEFTKIGDAV